MGYGLWEASWSGAYQQLVVWVEDEGPVRIGALPAVELER